MNFDLNGVDGKGFLGAAAGFTKLTGNTGATIRLGGAGRSQAEIMRGLNGAGKFELAEGVMSGVDIAQFVSGLDAAFKNRALPAGIGPSYTTAFSKLGGVFSVKNGVVHVGDFKLNGGNIIAEGAGQLDLGGQSIDFSLRPRLTEGGGLAGFGIPIRLKGGFGSVSAGLDTDLVGQIVAAKAKAKVQSELTKTITNSVGGDAGAIVGGLLGQGTPDSTEQPQSTDPVGNILGGILGGNQQQPANDNQPAEESEPEKKAEESETEKKEEPKADPLENALKDLFGGG